MTYRPFLSISYLFRFPAGGVVILCKSIDGQQEIGGYKFMSVVLV